MRTGLLRHRVTLQSPTESRNAYGETIKTWADVATVWAAVEPVSGREFVAAGQTQNETAVKITLRYYSGLLDTWRVSFNSKAYPILAVLNPDERNREMHLMCSEGVAIT